MWRFWLFFGVIDLSFGVPLLTGLQNGFLKCLMLPKTLNTCDFTEPVESVPKQLHQLYEKLVSVKSALGSEQYALSFDMIDTVPLSFVYLMPNIRLNDGSKYSVADVLRKAVTDEALAMKLMSSIRDNTQLKYFLYGLSGERYEEDPQRAKLSAEVEKTIANGLIKWAPHWSGWEHWHFQATMNAGTPLLAYLPNDFLNSLPLEGLERFLYHLRSHDFDLDEHDFYKSWHTKSMKVKRIWGKIAINKAEPAEKWTPKILKQFWFLLVGATAEELRKLPSDLRISPTHDIFYELNFNELQTRAVFDVLQNDVEELTNSDYKQARRQVIKLLPRQLNKFNVNNVDFWWFRNIPRRGSLSTEKQLFESLTAHNVIAKKLPSISPKTWHDDIATLGKLVYLIPASELRVFNDMDLSTKTLAAIDSTSLTHRQARYLTKSGTEFDIKEPTTITSLNGLLKSISAHDLSQLRPMTAPASLMEHLISHLPGDSVASTSALLEKFRSDISKDKYLVNMLDNFDYNQYFNLLGSKDIALKYSDITNKLGLIAQQDTKYHYRIRSLPNHVLSVLLASFRNELVGSHDLWTWDGLFNSTDYPVLRLFVSGLSCSDILKVHPADVLPVIAYYVREKRELNQAFPKNMQYCFQKAVTNYLKLKSNLRGVDGGLLDLLEPFEVKAVGGYIWSSLSVDVINTARSKTRLLTEIGQLPINQLLTATGGDKLQHLAHSYLSDINQVQIKLKQMNELGNLIWFIDHGSVLRLDPRDFRLFLESFEPEQARTLCVASDYRRTWARLLVEAFGKPHTWSSSTLVTLGDLMVVFDDIDLEMVNRTSWLEAGDILPKITSLYKFQEWPGKIKPVSFVQVCTDLVPESDRMSYQLSVKNLLRFYAEAAQSLLDTVKPAVQILKIPEEPNTLFEEPIVKSVSSSWSLVTESETEKTTASSTTTSTTTTTPATTTRDDLLDWYDDMTTQPDEMTTQGLEIRRKRSEEPEKKKRKFKKHFHKNLDNKKIFRSGDSKSDSEIKDELALNSSRSLVVEAISEDVSVIQKLQSASTELRANKKLTCEAIRMLGKSSSLVLNLEDIRKMSTTELEDCSEIFGSLDLPQYLTKAIWSRLNLWKSEGSLLEVGGLVTAIQEEDILKLNLSLSNPWSLENLAVLSRHITDPETMSLIADRFILDNADMSQFTVESLVSLGRLVCAMNPQILNKLLNAKPRVFLDSAVVLGSAIECDGSDVINTCIRTLAHVATGRECFGSTATWTAEDVTTLGSVVAGLPLEAWRNGLKTFSLTGLSPSAVQCIPPNIFKELSEVQLSQLPPLSASVVSNAQISNLTPSQTEMLERVRRQIPDSNLRSSHSSGNTAKPNYHSILIFVMPITTLIW